jgi:hypothetical protein
MGVVWWAARTTRDDRAAHVMRCDAIVHPLPTDAVWRSVVTDVHDPIVLDADRGPSTPIVRPGAPVPITSLTKEVTRVRA